jgi:hypothetical protein
MGTASITMPRPPAGGKYNAALASAKAEHQRNINRIRMISDAIDCLVSTEHLAEQGCTVELLWLFSQPWGRRFRHFCRLYKTSVGTFINAVRQWMQFCKAA